MPGPPMSFTDITILLLYGLPNQGKTTFAYFLENKTHITISLDPICISVCKQHSDILQPFLVPSTPIYHQIGRLFKKLLKDNSRTVLGHITDDILDNIYNQLDNHTKKYKFIIVEGYIMEAIPQLKECLVQYITQNNWRYWLCHK
jgi:hypothetical protein